jgi:peptidylprolyl isomerase
MRNFSVLTALLATAAVAFGGCGSQAQDKRDSAADSKPPADTTATTAATPAPAPTAVSTDLSKKPGIPKPTGDPPTKLVTKDIVVGKGPAAKKGDKVEVQYVGVTYSTGEQFDASWDNGGDPFAFTLGKGMVIPGWDQGIPGMKVGGRRELTIPADLAYGATGSPPTIGPNETLIFVVDMKKIS